MSAKSTAFAIVTSHNRACKHSLNRQFVRRRLKQPLSRRQKTSSILIQINLQQMQLKMTIKLSMESKSSHLSLRYAIQFRWVMKIPSQKRIGKICMPISSKSSRDTGQLSSISLLGRIKRLSEVNISFILRIFKKCLYSKSRYPFYRIFK